MIDAHIAVAAYALPPDLATAANMLLRGGASVLNTATLLFAPQPLPDGRGSVRSRFRAATVRERMSNHL